MEIALSLMSLPVLALESALEKFLDCGLSRLHLDVMDGHLVPDQAFGLAWVEAIRQRFPTLSLDVHLMVDAVSLQGLKRYQALGIDHCWVHPRASWHGEGREAWTDWALELHDVQVPMAKRLLVMTVPIGRSGQSAIPDLSGRIEAMRVQHPSAELVVDGGIRIEMLPMLKSLGVAHVVMGHGLVFYERPEEILRSADAL